MNKLFLVLLSMCYFSLVQAMDPFQFLDVETKETVNIELAPLKSIPKVKDRDGEFFFIDMGLQGFCCKIEAAKEIPAFNELIACKQYLYTVNTSSSREYKCLLQYMVAESRLKVEKTDDNLKALCAIIRNARQDYILPLVTSLIAGIYKKPLSDIKSALNSYEQQAKPLFGNKYKKGDQKVQSPNSKVDTKPLPVPSGGNWFSHISNHPYMTAGGLAILVLIGFLSFRSLK